MCGQFHQVFQPLEILKAGVVDFRRVEVQNFERRESADEFQRTGRDLDLLEIDLADVAVLIGIILVLVIRPGDTADDTYSYVPPRVQEKEDATVVDTIFDVVKSRLIRDYGYDEESATDILNFVASIFARGDTKEEG